jgi:DNA-binding IclR family transcriptional regulator
MDKAIVGDAALKHHIPVIDRMMDVLGQLESRNRGATIRDLVAQLKLPRTTIYRILNSLQRHNMVRRDDAGAYHLGRRLLGLAAHVAARASTFDLAAIATPELEGLSGLLGEGSKLSIIDSDGILVLAAAQGRRPYALSVAPGQRMPMHAGAASKLLLAHQPAADIDFCLSRPLVAFTPRSITDPRRLRTELARIRRLGWAQDKGENAPSILAFAAPVRDAAATVVGAISVPFLAGTEPSRMEEIRLAVIAAGHAISAAIKASG